MKKIPTLFVRGDDRMVRNEVAPGCEWVIDGEGVATVKYDGTACMVLGGMLYKRHRLKAGKPVPDGWLHHDFDSAATSGHGWLPVGDGAEDRWHRSALANMQLGGWSLGAFAGQTFELIGPRVQGNPHGAIGHCLVLHGHDLLGAPRTFDELRDFLGDLEEEGVVWHHTDGRMAKLKRRDFGYQWPVIHGDSSDAR